MVWGLEPVTLALWLIKAQFQTRLTATLLSMLAIALGVALGFAIDLINTDRKSTRLNSSHG